MSAVIDRIELLTATRGFDHQTCWVHARAGALPGTGVDGGPSVVMTMQKLRLSGSDIFYDLHDMRTDDLGASWSGPTHHPTLARRPSGEGIEACPCDFTPKWHEATGTLLGVGHVAHYVDDELMSGVRPRRTCYSIYDADNRTWSEWDTVAMPEADGKFYSSGAGSIQRVDLEDGTLLIPFSFNWDAERHLSAVTVMRCSFDGETLRHIEHGDELWVEDPRGLGEPSLTRFDDRMYLTLRNDVRGYVTVGDGLGFEPVRPWTFDDGEELGNYNTQQHWVTHHDALHLAYTRRGLDNDHVFRHRAPLVIAEVDPERLCVIRDTERVLVPERGARLGNFGVVEVSADETWVTVAEWMQPIGCEQYGSDNSVDAARVFWNRPNPAR